MDRRNSPQAETASSAVTDLPECDLIVDGALPGRVNMDRDAFLLDRAVGGHNRSVVRIYEWSEPTVTVGYFQKPDSHQTSELSQCPHVARLSGGGAILHDRELTYACVLPETHPVRANPVELYTAVHGAIIDLLADCGADARLRQDEETAVARKTAEPFLCFLRQDPRDIVLNGTKIVGSAQRRRRGNILQHGSILLAASDLTPQVPGITELCASFNADRFATDLPQTIARAVARKICRVEWPRS